MIHEFEQRSSMSRYISEFYHIAKATEFFRILIRLAHILENKSTACLIIAKLLGVLYHCEKQVFSRIAMNHLKHSRNILCGIV